MNDKLLLKKSVNISNIEFLQFFISNGLKALTDETKSEEQMEHFQIILFGFDSNLQTGFKHINLLFILS